MNMNTSPLSVAGRMLMLPLLSLSLAFGQATAPTKVEVPAVQIIPNLEVGSSAVLSHVYQSGSSGTFFNFLTMGGQDTLFPYLRLSMDLVLSKHNRLTFLYQPLTLNTRTIIGRNNSTGGQPVTIDDVTFAVGTPIDIIYGFDFWRVSWLYDFSKSPDTILGAGISLQLRNASISFTSADGSKRTISQNIGPVPILKVRAAHWFNPHFGLDFEVDGFYASGAVLNGSGKAFEGWIWDGALKVKTRLAPQATAFLSLRSIGGGAQGNNAYSYVSSTTTVNPFTYNSLGTMALSLGVAIE